MRSELSLLEKFIQHCHANQEGMSDTYIAQIYSNMQELLLVQFLKEELQHRQTEVDDLQKRVDTIKKIVKDAVNRGGNSSVEIVWDEILELEQALKGEKK